MMRLATLRLLVDIEVALVHVLIVLHLLHMHLRHLW